MTWTITRDRVCSCGARLIDLADGNALAYASVNADGSVECASAPNDRHAEVEAWLSNELALRAAERSARG